MKPECKTCKYRLVAIFKKPTIKQCDEYAKSIGFTSFDAEYFWWKLESCGWVDNKSRPYKSWKGIIQTWKRAAIRRGDLKPKQKTFKDRYEETYETNK